MPSRVLDDGLKTREGPIVQRVWSLRHKGYKRLRVYSFFVIYFWIDRKIKHTLSLPIARENTEKGGALYSLKRSIILQQKQNGLKFVRSLSGDEGMVWMLDTYIFSLSFGLSWRIKTITVPPSYSHKRERQKRDFFIPYNS